MHMECSRCRSEGRVHHTLCLSVPSADSLPRSTVLGSHEQKDGHRTPHTYHQRSRHSYMVVVERVVVAAAA